MRSLARRTRVLYPTLLLAAVLIASGCGDDDEGAPPAPTATETAAPVDTGTATRTATLLPSATRTATLAASATATARPTDTEEPTETPTAEPTETATAEPTATETAEPTATETAEPTPTETETAVPTEAPTETPTTAPLASAASRSSAMAIAPDESFVIAVNPDNDSVTVLDTDDDSVRARIMTGTEPVAAVVHPDGTRAYVVNRAEGNVVEITGLDTDAPIVSRAVDVGSEPTALALSPSGARLYVAEWAEGQVSIVDTASMVRQGGIDAPRNPRSVAVTNDGDGEDDDETLIVVEFYGEPNPDVDGCPNGTAEACDTGRIGRIRRYRLDSLAPLSAILFSPLDSGIVPNGLSGTVMTAPNQLYAAAVQGSKIYVPSVSASPQGPIVFNGNVYPVVYVGDLDSGMEDLSNVGTVNLAKLANDQIGDEPGTDRFFLQEAVDIAFAGSSDTAYVVSRAADTVQEVIYDGTTGVRLGLPQINLGASGCQNPIGIAIAPGLNRAYVDCWLTRRIAIIDLGDKSVVTVQSADLPPPESPEDDVRLGKRFYFTGRGRWSEEGEGYSSCASCHPDGLSDNITWAFAAGPRQTTSMDGTFSHGPGEQKRRILNWTAIFEELHDFERNTRGVSGGLGAITTSPTEMCGALAAEVQVAIPGDGLGTPVKVIQDTTPGVCTTDWDNIDDFVRTIRPPAAPRFADLDQIERGREQFQTANCANCHAGPGWTVSRRFWEPSIDDNLALPQTPFTPLEPVSQYALQTVQIGVQPAAADPLDAAVPPNEVACVLRRVGSFGVPGDETATNAIEVKVNNQRAQGAGGFNVPALYGMTTGAPYLHHGLARTLEDLFTDPLWEAHRRAGNPDYAPTAEQVDDLVAFIRSIDAETDEIDLTDDVDACPEEFVAPTPTATEAPTEAPTATPSQIETGFPTETPTPEATPTDTP